VVGVHADLGHPAGVPGDRARPDHARVRGGIDRVNFQFVAVRWQHPFWRTWDWLILSLATVHGINGLRVIILDYVRRPGTRIAVTWLFYVTGIVLFALGSIVVFTFDPSKWHA